MSLNLQFLVKSVFFFKNHANPEPYLNSFGMPCLDSIAPVAPPAAARGVAAGRGVSRSLRGRLPRFRPGLSWGWDRYDPW